MKVLSILFSLMILTSCGQSGRLYIPQTPPDPMQVVPVSHR